MSEPNIILENEEGLKIEGTDFIELVFDEPINGIERPEVLVVIDNDQNYYPLLHNTETDDFSFIQDEELLNAVSAALEGLMDDNESIETIE